MADNYVARQSPEWLVISILPDVCKTPKGPSTPPVPYPVIANLGEAVCVVPSVRANGMPLVVWSQSFVPTTKGDEAGKAKGVSSATVGGKCYPDEHSKTVRAGGKPILRHGDKFWMNGK
ncbi:DUF4150 domain-containing protein [Hafnia paralvei]|uniref:DUF4150 domain-containing protein n=1 Tax=Hafnia paralvei TaxID=546367 RepID=UPI003C2C94FA